MSFPHIRYCEIVDEEWETSALYENITSKFIMPVFRKGPGVEDDDEYYFDKVVVWNMPEKDIDIVHEAWEETRQKVIEGDYDNFIRQSHDRIVHIRPHARNKDDTIDTPQGTKVMKKSFWLNSGYIASIVSRPVIYNVSERVEGI